LNKAASSLPCLLTLLITHFNVFMDLNSYLNRFNGRPPNIKVRPEPKLAGVIVIPCYREPDWKQTLLSLFHCEPTQASFEVLIILNDSAADSLTTHSEHEHDLEAIQSWILKHQREGLTLHVVKALRLPKKHAGVGLARKIGMDEALHRLQQAGNLENGFIVGLDADCICQANYLKALETHFTDNPKTPGCSIHFEHPFVGSLDPAIYETAACYELHLRYYVEALRFAGFPHAFHTIGSSMAARAEAYMTQGGMNRRKAGEDFYFLNKIIPLGRFTELNSTTVQPSPRTSDRVPFGTGRAVAKYCEHSIFPTYAWDSILELRKFFFTAQSHNPFNQVAPSLPETQELPGIIVNYLHSIDGWKNWQACIDGTSGFETYKRRFFHWFDAFQCMKCMHFMRDQSHGEADVHIAARQLFVSSGLVHQHSPHTDTRTMLNLLRNHQKKGWQPNTEATSHLNS
jgi:hypothetical protein